MIAILRRLSAIAAMAMCATAGADVSPESGAADPRIRTATYSANEVYRIQGVVGYAIDLQFEAGERFIGMGSGDIEGISFAAQENHLFLKPKAPRVATNLTVLTSRRLYRFQYTVGDTRAVAGPNDIVYAINFAYPPPATRSAGGDESGNTSERLRQASERPGTNADYWYCGNPGLMPTSATDNGVQTRLRFRAQAELPAIFVRNDDGSESLLNFSVADGDLIVHRVARRLILRRGHVTGCVVNAAYSGGGGRLESGTISPDVRRETQGGGNE